MKPRIGMPHKRAAGFGLVEVLVAMAIGLVLLGAVGYLFVSSKQMNAAQTDAVRMQESVRNVMDVMGKAVRQAGYKLNVDVPLAGTLSDGLGGTDGGGMVADTLIVRHDPNWVRDTTPPINPHQGIEVDCEGQTVTSNNDITASEISPVNTNLVEYHFRIANGKLICSRTAGGAGVVVADNVENMQITYGLGNGSETITAYLTKPNADQFERISAVRVSLLLRGPTPNVSTGTQTIAYNGTTLSKSDGYLRRVVTSTFSIRNQMRW